MNTIYFTPLSLSQLFKEKGVKQESMFWHDLEALNIIDNNLYQSLKDTEGKPFNGKEDGRPLAGFASAFTLSELPDVFRQVYPKSGYMACKEWLKFCTLYFVRHNQKGAWDLLEKTIRELK